MFLIDRCALDSLDTYANILEPCAAKSFFAKSAKEFLIEKAACLPNFLLYVYQDVFDLIFKKKLGPSLTG